MQTNVQFMYRLNINNRTPHTGSTVHNTHEDCYICVTLSSETQGLLFSQQTHLEGEQREDNHALANIAPQKEMSTVSTGYATQAD
jgi:hypothetical protein